MAAVTVTMSADDTRMAKAMERLYRDQQKAIDKFKATGEASKAAADKATKAVENTATATAKITKASDAAASAIKNIATGYLSASSALSAMNRLLADQNALQAENLANVKKIGAAQEASGLNFSGLSDAEAKRAQNIALRVQKATGFSDRAMLSSAAGDAFSVAGDLTAVEKALTAAAPLALANPGSLKPLAVGALDMAKATGTTDAEKNLALVLSAQGAARVISAEGVSKSLPPTIASVQGSVPNQPPEAVAKYTSSQFAALTQRLVDKEGDISKTALIDFDSKIGEFFRNAGDSVAKADVRINELNKITADAANGRTPEQRKGLTERQRIELADLQQRKQSLSSLQDPGTVEGRISTLQQNTGARKIFQELDFGAGEAKAAFREFLDPSSALAKSVANNAKNLITTDSKFYTDKVRQLEITPELRISRQEAMASAETEMARSSPLSASTALISKVAGEALKGARLGNYLDATSLVTEPLNMSQIQAARNVPESAAIAQQAIEKRMSDIQNYRFTDMGQADMEKLRSLETALTRIAEIQKAAADQFAGTVQQFGQGVQQMKAGASMLNAARAQASTAGQ